MREEKTVSTFTDGELMGQFTTFPSLRVPHISYIAMFVLQSLTSSEFVSCLFLSNVALESYTRYRNLYDHWSKK